MKIDTFIITYFDIFTVCFFSEKDNKSDDKSKDKFWESSIQR